jgi:hypothetical protein
MIFCHIVDDYYLQGWLASAKQKKWWQENAAEKLYRFDYLWALLMHSFSWAFMVMLPIAFTMNFEINALFIVCFLANVSIHALTDNEKANRFTINLWIDQLIHIGQLVLTAFILL